MKTTDAKTKELNSLLLFDLESYTSRYDPNSETLLQRLLFIARHAPSKDLATSAFTMLEKCFRERGNYVGYREVFGKCPVVKGEEEEEEESCDEGGGGVSEEKKKKIEDETKQTTTPYSEPSNLSFTYSPNFTQTAFANSSLLLETLDSNLLSAQSHLDKEHIRSTTVTLATHHLTVGNIDEASRRYREAQKYCFNTARAVEVCILVLACALDRGDYARVRDLVARAEQRGGGGVLSEQLHRGGGGMDSSREWFTSHLQCALGLAYLAEGQFADAAVAFGRVRVVEGSELGRMMSVEDLAVYGGLLGLATMDRAAMSKSLDVEACRERLELIPQLRDAIRHYVRAEYGACLNQLEELRWSWRLDMYLAKHADVLWMMVRDKCIIQYFAPYTSVSLETMMESFGFFDSLEEVEEVVANLIEKKKIVGARIHGVNKTLSSMSVRGLERRERSAMMRKIGRMGDKLLREVEGTVLRLACLENNICVDKSRKGKKGYLDTRQNFPLWRDGVDIDMLGVDSNMHDDSGASDDNMYGAEDEDNAPSMMDVDEYAHPLT